MKPLSIGLKEAREIFPGAPSSIQTVLKDHFGSQVTDKITDRIKTFEDACTALGIDHDQALPYPLPTSSFQRGINAVAKLFIIIEALNEEAWQPDWTNVSQYKWYPWYEGNKSTASGLSFRGADNWNASTFVGSRLCFKTKELAEYAGRQFEAEYTEFFINK